MSFTKPFKCLEFISDNMGCPVARPGLNPIKKFIALLNFNMFFVPRSFIGYLPQFIFLWFRTAISQASFLQEVRRTYQGINKPRLDRPARWHKTPNAGGFFFCAQNSLDEVFLPQFLNRTFLLFCLPLLPLFPRCRKLFFG